MKALQLIATLIGMHIVGFFVLSGFLFGPSAILAGTVLSVFGWYFLPLEAMALGAIWASYTPYPDQKLSRTLRIGIVVSLLGAIMAAPFIPKEQNNENIFWLAGLLSGLCATSFAFICVHKMKETEIAKVIARE